MVRVDLLSTKTTSLCLLPDVLVVNRVSLASIFEALAIQIVDAKTNIAGSLAENLRKIIKYIMILLGLFGGTVNAKQ